MKKERDDRRVMNTNKEESNKHVWCCEIHNRYKYHNNYNMHLRESFRVGMYSHNTLHAKMYYMYTHIVIVSLVSNNEVLFYSHMMIVLFPFPPLHLYSF